MAYKSGLANQPPSQGWHILGYHSFPAFKQVAFPGLSHLTLLSAPRIVLPFLRTSLLTLWRLLMSFPSCSSFLFWVRVGGALRVEVKALLLSFKYRLFSPQLLSAVLTRLLSNSWVPRTLLPQPPEPFNHRFTNLGGGLENHPVAEDDPELLVLLLLPCPRCWHYRCLPLCSALQYNLKKDLSFLHLK